MEKGIMIDTVEITMGKGAQEELKNFVKRCEDEIDMQKVEEIIKESIQLGGKMSMFNSVMKHLKEFDYEHFSTTSNYQVKLSLDGEKAIITYAYIV